MSYTQWKNWLSMHAKDEQDTLLMAAAIACEFTGDAEEVMLFSSIARAHFDNYTNKEDTASFVNSLKKMREASGMSAQEVANKIGVHVTTYRMWERMATKPSAENILKLKELFLK